METTDLFQPGLMDLFHRQTFFLDFVHDGNGLLLLLFFLLHYRRSFLKASRWVAGLPFLNPKIQAYFFLHLMARLCPLTAWEWANIPRWVAIGTGQKIHFPFLSDGPLVAIKRFRFTTEIIKDFPHTRLNPNSTSALTCMNSAEIVTGVIMRGLGNTVIFKPIDVHTPLCRKCPYLQIKRTRLLARKTQSATDVFCQFSWFRPSNPGRSRFSRRAPVPVCLSSGSPKYHHLQHILEIWPTTTKDLEGGVEATIIGREDTEVNDAYCSISSSPDQGRKQG
jgi:hypothetical protein